jgi:hypothetical protein
VDDCEGCFARAAVGTFSVGDVETPLCEGCATYRTVDGDVILPNEPV